MAGRRDAPSWRLPAVRKVRTGRRPLTDSGTFQMRMVATKDEFDQLVTASASQALFVDFTASWCGP